MTTHGKSRLYRSTYQSWCAMKHRCYNPHSKKYARYGGRGIIVCERWKHSFEKFFADMGPKPDGFSIERMDNNGNYEPANCRWATNLEQQNNTRACKFLEHDGLRLSIRAWARRSGLDISTFKYRIRSGWPMARAISQRPMKKGTYERTPKIQSS